MLKTQYDKRKSNRKKIKRIWIPLMKPKWTASSEFGTYSLCEQRRFRRACASAQSRQNLRCSLLQAVSQEEPSDRKPDPWHLWMAGHAQLKFVMTECSKTQIRLTGLIFWPEKTLNHTRFTKGGNYRLIYVTTIIDPFLLYINPKSTFQKKCITIDGRSLFMCVVFIHILLQFNLSWSFSSGLSKLQTFKFAFGAGLQFLISGLNWWYHNFPEFVDRPI